MTTISEAGVTCSVCGTISKHRKISSTNEFGHMDLDTRPPEMRRSTMEYWVQECPMCGYVSGDLEEKTQIDRDFLSSRDYLDFEKQEPLSDLAKRFIREGRIAEKLGKFREGFFDYLCGAWASDDEGDEYWRKEARLLSLKVFDKISPDECDETLTVMKADLLRKSEQFERLSSEYSDIHFENELLNKIITFQIERAKQKDTATYTVGDVSMD